MDRTQASLSWVSLRQGKRPIAMLFLWPLSFVFKKKCNSTIQSYMDQLYIVRYIIWNLLVRFVKSQKILLQKIQDISSLIWVG